MAIVKSTTIHSTGATMFMQFAGRTPTGDLRTRPRQIVTGRSIFAAQDEDRKKVDRQTRKFRPLTDEVLRGHVVVDHTIGIYPQQQQQDEADHPLSHSCSKDRNCIRARAILGCRL